MNTEKKTAADIYQMAKENGMALIGTCISFKQSTIEHIMNDAVKADGRQIRRLIRIHLPDLYHSLALKYYNPYERQSKRTDQYLIYVHSNIEYFIRIFN